MSCCRCSTPGRGSRHRCWPPRGGWRSATTWATPSGARLVLVLIGERPGLSSHDSLGAYLTWDPRPGVLDSARNCVSNIRPPHGLGHATAARTIASLIVGARRLGGTGVRLKAGGRELPA